MILDRAANGMEVIYIPGNHDTGLRNYASSTVKGVRIEREAGLICGHIHSAALEFLDGKYHSNIGDWVESCTALLEDEDGMLRRSLSNL